MSLHDELEETGRVLLRRGPSLDPSRDPWAYAEALFGAKPLLVERQPIRDVGGRSFASSSVFTPLHTDSQALLGVPASAQVLVCVRPAESGGETTLADSWRIVERIEQEDRALHARLFSEERTLRFYFGTFRGPTVARRGGHVFFTHPPLPDSELAQRIQGFVDREPREVLRVESGEVLVVDNHRMLHGRLAFTDARRELVRLLVWLDAPFRAPDSIAKHALEAAPFLAPSEALSERELTLVRELLRGTPPGLLERREGVKEEQLYRWRDAAFALPGWRGPGS